MNTPASGGFVQRCDVAIVGGGIAGCALAAVLAPLGLEIVLVEAAPPPGPPPLAAGIDAVDPRVSALSPASIRLLEDVGAWSLLPPGLACAYRRMSVWEEDGSGAIEFAAADVGADALGAIVENRWVVSTLARVLARQPGVRVLAPETLEALEPPPAPAERVRLRLASGMVLEAKLAVGADGARSRVRELCGIGIDADDMAQRAIVATIRSGLPHQATAWQNFLASGPLALLPLNTLPGERACSIVWSADTARAEELLALDDAAFAEALGRAAERRLGAIEGVSRRFAFTLCQQHARSYVAPGVVLVADAAHVVHPLAGQGINLGLADVRVLGEEIGRAVERGLPIADAGLLARYQRRRRGDNAAMLQAMKAFRHGFGATQPFARLARNIGMGFVDRAGPLKRLFMRHAMGL